ncbi:response to stress [Ascochyta rabiei]|uniref:Response to stress n=1 Tax=Didymella rabiei TaxID=5454 RepID=A0A163IGB9_DIDRA|nr:response to stress [Ascochyta rabiei]
MSSLTAAIDQEMKEHRDARKNSGGGRRAESPLPGGRHQSPAPGHLGVDDGRVRSRSRGSTGIPFAMPKSAPSSPRGARMSGAAPYQSIASVSQGGPKPRAMSSVYGTPSGILGPASPRDRHNSMSGAYNRSKSGSPGPERSASPRTRGPPMSTSEAMRKMSESAMTDSDGELTAPPRRKASDPAKGTTSAPGGGVRLTTDDDGDDGDDGEDSAAVESSDNDSGSSSDWDDGWAPGSTKKSRGRRRSRSESGGTDRMGREIVTAQSLFKTAKEEGRDLTASFMTREERQEKLRQLNGPTISIEGPDGEKMVRRKSTDVHPHTSFDQDNSRISTPISSDAEDHMAELRSAQQLALQITPIQSSPEAHRCVRQIVRGDYSQFAQEADNGLRRQRVYLVSTDLSDEAAYALEWTIGTVLRDGDTLLAVYAVDEEIGVATDGLGAPVAQGTTGLHEGAHLKRTLSGHDGIPQKNQLSSTIAAAEADVSKMGKAEKDRYQACVEVSDRCVKLLRKTRLQARVVVEVFHCKSPKHMITEVIDMLEPTLVILGSRGRNALKGVLLGSFSNYLVTKSSVPVMVARKRLRKHSKYKRQNLRMSNVLTGPGDKLANAKID